MELKKIKTDRIILSKNKEAYDEGEVFLLAKSIALAGLLSPITVVSLCHSDRYEIVSGNKRFYACRLLGFKEIPALVIEAEPTFARTVLEKENHNDFFREADTIKEAILKTHLSADELSNLSAYSNKEILSLLRLSSMSDLEREIVKNNYINKEIACEIAALKDIKKRNSLLSEISNKRIKLSDIPTLIDREKRAKPFPFKSRAHRTPKFKDLRLFDNTLIKAIQILREAGVEAQLDTEKTPTSTEYKIKIRT